MSTRSRKSKSSRSSKSEASPLDQKKASEDSGPKKKAAKPRPKPPSEEAHAVISNPGPGARSRDTFAKLPKDEMPKLGKSLPRHAEMSVPPTKLDAALDAGLEFVRWAKGAGGGEKKAGLNPKPGFVTHTHTVSMRCMDCGRRLNFHGGGDAPEDAAARAINAAADAGWKPGPRCSACANNK